MTTFLLLQGLNLGPHVDILPDHDGFTDVIKDEKWKEDRIFAQRRLAGICPFFLQQVTNSGIDMQIRSKMNCLSI